MHKPISGGVVPFPLTPKVPKPDGKDGDKPRFKPGHSHIWYANQPIDHKQTLLGERYLCRGGGMFVVAPSGMGKSTLSIQMAVLWTCGLIAFGIRPRKALRILIVQSEDDQGDCTEMTAMKDQVDLTATQKQMADENTDLIRCNDLVGLRFIEALRTRLQEAFDEGKPFDLVIINPYGVYLGADVKDTDACTKFLNEWLNPLLTQFEVRRNSDSSHRQDQFPKHGQVFALGLGIPWCRCRLHHQLGTGNPRHQTRDRRHDRVPVHCSQTRQADW
jgi:AAA domain